ncbi:1-acyl-sn-glycerol-3-phosphate acyltransferase [Paracrocinitomix mangrovi]|uniref:lysophospholipid acyltransferase family protein n=1 Tax=Paracrocinitomix mangrovi TaxID=2862509 RepID=UPI001C8E3E35|nr:lysophospholipid acyltransferase family protein [Paracrocinitomix mangrovi]UKN00296.1 1-acyl-sn-glycerol-3-phosphate acyltransferase [Paracrocinitomix mangrovi]
MKYLLLPLVIVYRIYFAIIFFVVLTLLYPVFWVMLLKDKNFEKVFKLKVFTSRIILFLDFIFLKRIKMPDNLPEGPYVICANHCSYLDIILMYPILPKTKFMFIGKAELLRWPVISIFFKNMDIGVNREKRHSAMKSIIRAKKEIQRGWSIVIYPEGKIPHNNPKLNLFKSGAFKMAIEEQVPILPITLIDTWKLFATDPPLTAWARPGISRVVIHDPIPTKGLEKKDLVNLRQQTFDVINGPLLEYNKKVIDKL